MHVGASRRRRGRSLLRQSHRWPGASAALTTTQLDSEQRRTSASLDPFRGARQLVLAAPAQLEVLGSSGARGGGHGAAPNATGSAHTQVCAASAAAQPGQSPSQLAQSVSRLPVWTESDNAAEFRQVAACAAECLALALRAADSNAVCAAAKQLQAAIAQLQATGSATESVPVRGNDETGTFHVSASRGQDTSEHASTVDGATCRSIDSSAAPATPDVITPVQQTPDNSKQGHSWAVHNNAGRSKHDSALPNDTLSRLQQKCCAAAHVVLDAAAASSLTSTCSSKPPQTSAQHSVSGISAEAGQQSVAAGAVLPGMPQAWQAVQCLPASNSDQHKFEPHMLLSGQLSQAQALQRLDFAAERSAHAHATGHVETPHAVDATCNLTHQHAVVSKLHGRAASELPIAGDGAVERGSDNRQARNQQPGVTSLAAGVPPGRGLGEAADGVGSAGHAPVGSPPCHAKHAVGGGRSGVRTDVVVNAVVAALQQMGCAGHAGSSACQRHM